MACSTCGQNTAQIVGFDREAYGFDREAYGFDRDSAYAIEPLATCPSGVPFTVTAGSGTSCATGQINVFGTCVNQTMLIAAGGVAAAGVIGVIAYMMLKGKKKSSNSSSYFSGGY